MIINLVDSRSGNFNIVTAPDYRSRTQSTNVFVCPSETLDRIVGRVAEASRNLRNIWLLRIMAHGNTGWVQLGCDGLTANNAGRLGTLKEYFTPGGIGIAIHSCGPASATRITASTPYTDLRNWVTGEDTRVIVPGTVAAGGGRGVDFLKNVASACGVPARGGIHAQLPDSRFRFEGNSIIALPNGRAFPINDWGRLANDTTRIARQS